MRSQLGSIPIRGLPRGLPGGLPGGLPRGLSSVAGLILSALPVLPAVTWLTVYRWIEVAPQLKSICRAEAGGRPRASLIFNVFGQIIEDSMGFSTLV